MNMGGNGPSRLPEQGHEPACRFLGVATALGLHAHHPGNLGGTSGRATGRHCHLHCSDRMTGVAHPYHPVAPQLMTLG